VSVQISRPPVTSKGKQKQLYELLRLRRAAVDFAGGGQAMTQKGFDAVARRLRIEPATLWALVAVETAGCGFLPDRRPQILFERHLFHRLTKGMFDDGDVSAPTPGGYGALGAGQYDRLAKASRLNRDAALQSTSWGIGQILGLHYATIGFPSVVAMVNAMTTSEDTQLTAVGAFLVANHLDAALQQHDWTRFAAAYNGSAYATHRYDVRLHAEYEKQVVSQPDLNVRAVQLYLTYLGFSPGPIDGVAGALTRSAVAAFRRTNGADAGDTIDEPLESELWRRVVVTEPT
jgi:hypothetical protein